MAVICPMLYSSEDAETGLEPESVPALLRLALWPCSLQFILKALRNAYTFRIVPFTRLFINISQKCSFNNVS